MRPIRGRADRRTASIHPPKDSPGATSEEFAADVGDDEAFDLRRQDSRMHDSDASDA